MGNAFDDLGAGVCRYLLIASLSAAGLVALAWIVIRLGRVRAAVYRHSIWLYCMAGIVVVPLLWMYAPKLKLAVLPPSSPALPASMELPDWTPPARSALPAAPIAAGPVAPPSTAAVAPASPTLRAPRISVTTLLAVLWAVGVTLMLLRLAIGWLRLRRLRLSAHPLDVPVGRLSAGNDDVAHSPICAGVPPAAVAGVAQPPSSAGVPPASVPVDNATHPPPAASVSSSVPEPRLFVTSSLSSPVCCGIFSPVILLPEELVHSDDPSRLRMALNHELAHIERRDIAANALQRLVEALFFFHPLVWYASRLLTQERERICDNWVVAQGADANRYAEFLADLAERAVRRQRLAGVALCENGLVGRVKDLLDPRHARLTRASRLAALACALAAILAFGVFGVLRLSRAEEKAAAPLDQRDAAYADMLALYPDAAKLKLPTDGEIAKLGAVWPSVPPEENAAYCFARAGRALPPEAEKPDGAANVGSDRPYAGDLDAMVKWVEKNREALRLYREATRLGFCRFPLVRSPDSPHLYAPTPVWVRQVAMSATDAAFVAEMQGRQAEAVAFYADCLRAGAILRRQGTESSAQLVGVATCSVGQGRLAALTANAVLDEATLREVIRCLHEAEVAPGEAAQAMGNEVAYEDAVMPLIRQAGDATQSLAMWRTRRTVWTQFVRGKTLTQLLQKDAAKEIVEIGESVLGGGENTYTPSILFVFGELGRCDARLKAQEIRAALTLYRQTHNGAWPDSLDALVPGILTAVPLDPFDGKPMRYARAGNGWKVWSVGEDNVDNGGQGDPDPVKVWNGPDFVFVSDVPSNLERRSDGKMKSASAAPPSPRTDEEYRQALRDAVLAVLPKQVTATRVAANMATTPPPMAGQGSAAPQGPVLVLSFEVTTPAENESDMLLIRVPKALRTVTLPDRKTVVVKDVLVSEPLLRTIPVEGANRPSRILFSSVSVVLMGFDEFQKLVNGTRAPSPVKDRPAAQ